MELKAGVSVSTASFVTGVNPFNGIERRIWYRAGHAKAVLPRNPFNGIESDVLKQHHL